MKKPTDVLASAFALPFQAIGYGAKVMIAGRVLNQQTGAHFAKPREYKSWLNTRNDGLLLDGQTLRLSERESFQNVCLIARVGAGKTSRYIVPNVLDKAKRKCSVVVNDPKGEVFDQTSAAMKKAGYKIIVIDPENPARSSRFNPLLEARDDIELDQIAEILVRTGNPGEKDGFWNRGATRFVSLFLKVLRNAAQSDGEPVFTLSNLAYLFQNFGQDGRPLRQFMSWASVNPHNVQDARLWNEWKGLLTGNPEGVQSFVLNALTALRAMSNPNLAWITAASDISLADLRRQKTIIYFITPPQHQAYYSFLTSIFFRSVFNAAMRQMPSKRDLPIYVLYDEFGHSTIPDFVSTANTIRGYRVSLSIVLQSISQLAARYGADTAQAIQGGFNTAMTYSGSDPETAFFFERIAGKVRERQKKDFSYNPQDNYREFNLLNANEVRTLGGDEALVVSTNRMPVLLKTRGFFENSAMAKLAAKPPVQMPLRPVDPASLPYVRL